MHRRAGQGQTWQLCLHDTSLDLFIIRTALEDEWLPLIRLLLS